VVVAHAARSLMTMRLHRRFGDPVSAGVGDVKGVLGPGVSATLNRELFQARQLRLARAPEERSPLASCCV